MNEEQRRRIAGYLGLAQRAGKIAAGDSAAKTALVKGKAELLVLAEDAADSVKAELQALAGEEVPVPGPSQRSWEHHNDIDFSGIDPSKRRLRDGPAIRSGFFGKDKSIRIG